MTRRKLSVAQLQEALESLGALLEDAGHPHELVLIGGGALLLLGLIDRPTEDLDAVARVEDGTWEGARPFPPVLQGAIEDVAAALGIPPTWLNSGPTMVLKVGLPTGFAERVETRQYGALTLRLASRVDQIALKLDAAADKWPDKGKHLKDLQLLSPTPDELLAARGWCAGHRSSQSLPRVHEVMTFLLMGGNDAWV